MNTGTFMVLGIMVGVMIAALFLSRKAQKKECEYDEMQLKIRAKGYQIGFYTALFLMIVLILLCEPDKLRARIEERGNGFAEDLASAMARGEAVRAQAALGQRAQVAVEAARQAVVDHGARAVQFKKLAVPRGVLSSLGLLADLARLHRLIGMQPVQDGRLADSRSSGQCSLLAPYEFLELFEAFVHSLSQKHCRVEVSVDFQELLLLALKVALVYAENDIRSRLLRHDEKPVYGL